MVYGLFPEPCEWEQTLRFIKEEAGASQPGAIWVVGVIARQSGESWCRLGFPGDSGAHEKTSFNPVDQNEAWLDSFDRAGIQVWLQVEPGDADVEELIDLVLDRYGHHRCIAGFGVDLEWYRTAGTDGWGTRADDGKAESWERAVKAHNQDYSLFLKHWDPRWMPPSYRG